MGELSSLIRSGADITALAAYLDALPAARREDEATSLGRRDQARLFDVAADASPIRVAHFVPVDVPPLTPVHHPGRNTILTLPYFQRFQKRFARADERTLIGYNASNASFVHPGYFVAYETDGNAEWETRGGVVVDYHRVPEGPVPEGWPAVRPNSVGLQKLVYHQTRDFMRAVSAHVSIGRASRETQKRGDEILDYWFTLCRQDESASGEQT